MQFYFRFSYVDMLDGQKGYKVSNWDKSNWLYFVRFNYNYFIVICKGD